MYIYKHQIKETHLEMIPHHSKENPPYSTYETWGFPTHSEIEFH